MQDEDKTASGVRPDGTPVRLGDLQLAILRVLWGAGQATAVEVHRFAMQP